MALPGILPPVRHDGRVLVDGGLRAPVPVRACRELGAAIVLSSQMRVGGLAAGPSQRPRPVPLLPDLVSRAIDIMQEQLGAENSAGADVPIETSIPLGQAGLFDFSHRQETEAAGEAAARAALDSVRERLPGLRRSQRRAA
jgi:NTE family protein